MMHKKFVKTLAIFAFIFGGIFIYDKQVEASEAFNVAYDIEYELSQTGEAAVSQKVSIENKESETFVASYYLNISNVHIYDVVATNKSGNLDIIKEEQDNITKLQIIFKDQIVGVGRKNEFTLKYKTQDVASKVGNIWNIHIPKVENLQAAEKYDVSIKIPETYGPKIYVSPERFTLAKTDNYTTYFFDKKMLEDKGISASFGEYQTLNFKLEYHLKNDSTFAALQEIAIPPDIKHKQQVSIQSLDPLPIKIRTDADGNILATYKINPKKDLIITLIGSARLSGKQILPEFGARLSDLPGSLVRTYTMEDTYWEVSSPTISQKATELLDKSLTVSENAQKAYEYTLETLEYDFEVLSQGSVERKGAIAAIENPKVACMEFTDLFIAVTRAMGIPARALDGFAYSKDSSLSPLFINLNGTDLLHSWAEYYDPNFGWVPVDPTWGKTSKMDYFTKVDTNHLVFAIKGLDSEYPFPAGTYKVSGDEKQVEVDFAQDTNENIFKGSVVLYPRKNPLYLLNKKIKYIAYNNGGVILYNFNGSNETLLPFEQQVIFLKPGETAIYEDFNGNGFEVDSIDLGEPPDQSLLSKQNIIAVCLALVLCMMIYFSASRLKDPKKGLFHRSRRHQDQDQ